MLNNASHLITTSGMTATLEGLALRTPVSFLPPTNLSQWKQMYLFSQKNLINKIISWADLLKETIDVSRLTEGESIPVFRNYSKKVYKKPILLELFKRRLIYLINQSPSVLKSNEFISKTKINGDQLIVRDLLKYLD